MVECGNRGGGIWRCLACLSAGRRSWRLGQPQGWLRRWMDQRTRLRWGRWVDQRSRGWWRGLGQSPVLWRRRCLGQSLVNDPSNRSSSPLEPDRPVKVLPAHLADGLGGGPFVAIVRLKANFSDGSGIRLRACSGCWSKGLLGDPDAWAKVAQGESGIPVDVHVAAPASVSALDLDFQLV
jgi:hypothetical protein